VFWKDRDLETGIGCENFFLIHPRARLFKKRKILTDRPANKEGNNGLADRERISFPSLNNQLSAGGRKRR